MSSTNLSIQWNEAGNRPTPVPIRRVGQRAARHYPIVLFREFAKKSVRMAPGEYRVIPTRVKP